MGLGEKATAAVLHQHWAGTGLMLAASAQYWHSSGMLTGNLPGSVPEIHRSDF